MGFMAREGLYVRTQIIDAIDSALQGTARILGKQTWSLDLESINPCSWPT